MLVLVARQLPTSLLLPAASLLYTGADAQPTSVAPHLPCIYQSRLEAKLKWHSTSAGASH
jgi:hypothetical protein